MRAHIAAYPELWELLEAAEAGAYDPQPPDESLLRRVEGWVRAPGGRGKVV